MPERCVTADEFSFARAFLEIARPLQGAQMVSFRKILPEAVDVAIQHRRQHGKVVTATADGVVAKVLEQLPHA